MARTPTSRSARGRLRRLAILSGRVRASLAVTGGVHTAVDAVKAVMPGNMNMQACPDPKVYERANCMLVLQRREGEQRQRRPLHAALHPQA